jgi:hypothetical protein
MSRINKTPERRRLVRIIQEAKGLRTYPDIVWESCYWNIKPHDRNRRAHNRDPCRLLFTRRKERCADPAVPFAPIYGDLAKALIRMRASSRAVGAGSQKTMVLALRFLYETLQTPHNLSDPARLTRRHFHVALEEAQRHCTVGSACNIGHALAEIAGFLNTHQISRTRIRFQNVAARPWAGIVLTRRLRQRVSGRCPRRKPWTRWRRSPVSR